MSVDCFLDTNILIYAALGRFSDPRKYAQAKAIIAENHFGISGQILAEFFVNSTKKSDTPLTKQEAMGWIEDLRDRPCAPVDFELVTEAIKLSQRYQTSYWDGAILASAHRLGAPVLYTEDLNHTQLYGSVRVINPFVSP